ncbi:hypothetical protein HZI73_08450 [Vallitalea pronyensis]|uniref:Uncharacterized protein n=1 Tax=Vallitalea pronyensis TaxID=1348613 RepID=A0A8J8MJ06_9FIRM|nr:hypothetical protein [Vallitalea pronyensis]QUI22327.1 hypothetical protein HZI73_08450 [Vallitalea pronyensis]
MAKKKVGLMAFIKFYKENGKAFKAYPLRDRSRTHLTLANMKIGKLDNRSSIYQKRVQELNDGMIYHYLGKWYATEAIKTKSKATWKKAFQSFQSAIKIANELNTYLTCGSNHDVTYVKPVLQKKQEIMVCNDVPLVPDITPVVILQGSSFDMGYQYAQQLVAIYGDWMLTRHSTHEFSKEEEETLRKWEDMHREHTPEIIDFAKGWASYAAANHYSLDYDQVLDLWVGHKPPASSYLNAESGIPELPPLACTALAAWNEASRDKKLVVGATGDHDMSYQITIVMYPDDGIPLIFTPFEATGTLPTVGPNWFFGHPGMNKAGLAYVHHGGGPKLLEPISQWGYGIRRGASVLHMLRYKRTAKEALEQEIHWPIGDIGYGDQATVGGFYADSDYGYIIESRKQPLCIREAGLLGERDYLFSNNSTMHPDAIESGWMSNIKELWTWDNVGGWRPKKPQGMTKSLGMIFKWFTGRLKTDELMSRGMMFAYWNSYNRNLFLNHMGNTHHGTFDVDIMKKVYRTAGTMPDGPMKKLKKAYVHSGKWGLISAAHASNALVVSMKPDEGLYSLCTGPAIRGAAPISPDLAITIYNERNAFWDIQLGDTPESMVNQAQLLAQELMEKAKNIYHNNPIAYAPKDIYDELLQEIKNMEKLEKNQENRLFHLNKRIRCYTRVHVLARQFINFFVVPEKFVYNRRNT